MELTRSLVADLYDLALDLGIGGCDTLTAELLKRDLGRAAPAALGMSITLVPSPSSCDGVFLHLLPRPVEPAEIQAWLHLELDLLVPGLSGRATFYGAEPGGLDDLGRALEGALDLDPGTLDESALVLDGPLVPGTHGLDDLTVVNRALGVLLHRGATLDAARDELRRRADVGRTTVTVAARALLDGDRGRVKRSSALETRASTAE